MRILTAILSLVICAAAVAGPVYPLKLQSGAHYMVDQTGAPFLVSGDSPWFLTVNPVMTPDQVDYYLSNRWVQGYNSIILDLTAQHINSLDSDDRNTYGDLPFTNTFAGPFTNLLSWNIKFFTNVDNIISRAGYYGINVFAYPLYDGDVSGGAPGWYPQMAANSSNTLYAYGNFIGNRYKKVPNIVWLGAGDYTEPNAATTNDLWSVVASGIKDADPNHLISSQPHRPSPGTTYGWVTVNDTYPSYFTYVESLANYQHFPAVASFDREPYYLGRTGIQSYTLGDLDTRAFGWWSLLSGDGGCFYGDDTANEGWSFGANWKPHLWDAGSTTFTNIATLLKSRPWWNLVPDTNHTVVTAGYGTSGQTNYVTVARDINGTCIIAYVMGGRPTLTVDMTKVSGGTRAVVRWFDPRNATNTTIQSFATSGTQNLQPPDTKDWVMLIDNRMDWYINAWTNGNGNGQSWANECSPSTIPWSSIQAGDNVWLDGGPANGVRVYTNSITDQLSSPNPGVTGNNTTIRVGQDTLHNGLVKILAPLFISRNYWTIDGYKATSNSGVVPSPWIPASVNDTYFVGTNCNIEVASTNNTSAVQMFGTGSKCHWVHVSHMSSTDDTGIAMVDGGPSRPIGDGSEVAYNWISHSTGYALRGEIGNFLVDTWGQIRVHHNLVEGVNDNFAQYSSHVRFDHNVCRNHVNPDVGHPDCIQEINAFSEVDHNIFYNFKGSRNYIEANNPNNHDIAVHNNLYFSTTNWYGQWYTNTLGQNVTNNPGTGFDMTGHDANPNTACVGSNLWYFNNTTFLRGSPNSGIVGVALVWSSGTLENPRSPAFVTNMDIFNNCIIQTPPFNTGPSVQMPTNLSVFNDSLGFSYSTNNVRFDYNNISRGSGKGNGLSWGPRGTPDLSNIYTNLAQFDLETQYKSNNNNTATFIALPDNEYYTNLLYSLKGYFRPTIGDTALVQQGTNLTSYIATLPISSDALTDIYGTAHPASGAWTIGAIEIPSGFWVSKTNGNDSNAGTFSAPWKTVQHAANVMGSNSVVNIVTGQYDEDVSVTVGNQSFVGYPANDQNNPVLVKTFTDHAPGTKIEGITFHKWANNNSAIYVYPPSGFNNGSGIVVTNNTFRDGIAILSTNTSFFNSATVGSNYIQCTAFLSGGSGTNFADAGFVPGMNVYLGSYSLKFYTNCGGNPFLSPGVVNSSQFYVVDHVSADGSRLYITNIFLPDPGTNYFAWIVGGNNGPKNQFCLEVPVGGSIAASNITFVRNTVTNTWGCQIDTGPCQGTNEFSDNLFTAFHGQYLANPNASNMHWARNRIIRNKGIFHFADGELSNPLLHPGGGQFYDGYCSLFQSAQDGQTNVCFEYNEVVDCDNEGVEIDWGATQYGWLFQYNIFYGMPIQGSIKGNGILMHTNLFIRCGYDERTSDWTGTGNTSSQPMNGSDEFGNVWVNTGGHFNTSQEAPFGTLTNPPILINFTLGNNVSINSETMGWGKTLGDNYVVDQFGAITTGMLTNNGDPVFINVDFPFDPTWVYVQGADPRKELAGCAPSPSSYLSSLSIGALPTAHYTNVIAHFNLSLTSPGWKDGTLTNFDSIWTAETAYQRPDVIRPIWIPEALGSNSATCSLDASASLDGLGRSNSGITNYLWNFQPENVQVSTNSPYISHTFTRGGTNTVFLTATAYGQANTYSNSYRILGNGSSDPIITSQPSSQTIYVNQSATFSLSASGTAVIHYYWQFNGSPVGLDQPSFTTNSVLIGANGGALSCLVSNSVGQITSSSVTLTVIPDPHISVQPQNQTVAAGASATFTLTADGASPLHYAWVFRGISVGTDSPTYTRVNCQPGDNGGQAQCTVSDSNGNLVSSMATLTVTGGSTGPYGNHVGKGHVGKGNIQ